MFRLHEGLYLPEQAVPATPDAGFGALYFKTDGKVYAKNDAGVETELGGGGGSVPRSVVLRRTANAGAVDALTTAEVQLINWDIELWDDDATHAANASDIVIPAAWNGKRVRFDLKSGWTFTQAVSQCSIYIKKNAVIQERSRIGWTSGGVGTENAMTWLDDVVATGDIYTAWTRLINGDNVTRQIDYTRSVFRAQTMN